MNSRWDTIYANKSLAEACPAKVLLDHAHLLPKKGTALDLACGLGANALQLAQSGLETWAWDSSLVAIGKLKAESQRLQLKLHAQVRDIREKPFVPAQFDVIVVSHFLDRSLTDTLITALKPDGLLFYQTFTRIRVGDSGPSNPDFRLNPNELLHLFHKLHIVAYREESCIGDLSTGWRNQALLVAHKQTATDFLQKVTSTQ